MPTRVSWALLLPETVTPGPLLALRLPLKALPWRTDTVSVCGASPLSRSPNSREPRLSGAVVSSVAAIEAGRLVRVVGSSTAVTATVRLAVAVALARPLPSLAVTVIWRGVVPGLSELLEKRTARRADWKSAGVGEALTAALINSEPLEAS